MSLTNYDLDTEYSHYNIIKNESVIEIEVIKKQNLKVLSILQEEINKKLNLNTPNENTNLETTNNLFSSGLFNFLVGATALETFTTSFIFGLGIISLIPAISQPLLFSSAIVFATLDTFIACSFQMSYLAECMGIKNHSGVIEHIDLYTTQLEILDNICTQLQHRNWNSNDDEYAKFIEIFNAMLQELEQNTGHIINYKSSEFLNSMKYFIILFGIASTIASSYFMSSLIIDSLAGPIGHAIAANWAILFIVIIVFANVSAYLLTTHYSLSNLFEPGLEKINHFKDDYRLFKINHDSLISTIEKDLEKNNHHI